MQRLVPVLPTRRLGFGTEREMFVATVALLLLTAGTALGNGSLIFSVSQLSSQQLAMEPTLSYAPNSTIWYSGMDDDFPGNLWYAVTDTSPFGQEPDPPTTGGDDAVVHHDLDGRLFWATINASGAFQTEVAVRQGGAWSAKGLGALDRPWFRTVPSGTTYLGVNNITAPDDVLEIWRYDSASPRLFEPHFTNIAVTTRYGDFANHTDGRLYLLYEIDGTNWRVAHRGPSESSWTFTSSFPILNDNAFPRLTVDLAGNVYVINADIIAGNNSLWLRHLLGSGQWSAPKRLCAADVTCSHPSTASGSAGKVGAGWYETDGNFDPAGVPSANLWRYRYGLFENANGDLSAVERTTVKSDVHKGPLDRQVGDFSSAVRREGDSQGRAALAFACNYRVTCEPQALSDRPLPIFAVQTGGAGLL